MDCIGDIFVDIDSIHQWRTEVASCLDIASSIADSGLGSVTPFAENALKVKKRKLDAMDTSDNDDNDDNDDNNDHNLEVTPRPAKRPFGVLDPELPPPTFQAQLPQRDTSQASSERSSKRSRSVAASGSSSPIKQIAVLRNSLSPIESDGFEKESVKAISKSMQNLVKEMRRCSGGQRIVPQALSGSLRALDSEEPIWDGQDIWKDTDDGDLDRIPALLQIEIIVQESNRCKARTDIEAGWSSHVHGPLLTLATWLSRHRLGVATVNLTQAKLLHRLRPEQPLTGKMVDFGIYLCPSESLELSKKDIKPEDDGTRCWNHTDALQVMHTPLAVAIEAKRLGEGGIKGTLQISVWARAHLQRLAELKRSPRAHEARWSVCLPLLVVQGKAWYFHLARGEFREGNLVRTVIHSDISLGDTSTFSGCFKVLAALMAIVVWCEETYRPWFEVWVSKSDDAMSSDERGGVERSRANNDGRVDREIDHANNAEFP